MDLTSSDLSWVVDVAVVLLVLVSAYLAMTRGVIRELFALLSWAAAFFAAFAFAAAIQPLLMDLPVVGPKLAANCGLSMVVAFVIVFGIALIITSILIWLFSGQIRSTALSVFDQGLGFIYGAVRGLVLVAVIFIAYQRAVPEGDQYAMIQNAATIGVVQQAASIIEGMMPEEIPDWLRSRVDGLLSECGAEEQ
ncbi:MAG: CvpA family protein [Neomegalonema sp.]|nr:CvpA family protein [Neomegalonema sp.]